MIWLGSDKIQKPGPLTEVDEKTGECPNCLLHS